MLGPFKNILAYTEHILTLIYCMRTNCNNFDFCFEKIEPHRPEMCHIFIKYVFFIIYYFEPFRPHLAISQETITIYKQKGSPQKVTG
jgi:hypothetical protein